MLNTSGYTSRYFNVIKEEGNIIIKSSTHIEKINNEYKYYYYLPKEVQKYFVKPYEFFIKGSFSGYYMEKINLKNAGELLLDNQLSTNSFIKLINKIIEFQEVCILSGEIINCSKEDSEYLVIEKTKERIKDKSNLDYLLDRITNAYSFYLNERSSWNKIISHGDLCLSNILWNDDKDLLLLIDPRGSKDPDDIYMDEYYDLAKLSHSILGGYENIIYNSNTNNLISQEIKDYFYNFIISKNISMNLIRVYEASLFLSMIPLHEDKPENIKLFEYTCDKILKEIGF